MVKEATLKSQFDAEELAELLEPQAHVSTPPDDPVLRLSLLNYISFMGDPQGSYEAACRNTHHCYPDTIVAARLLQSFQVTTPALYVLFPGCFNNYKCTFVLI
jgi:hypothetical protein